jgi:lipopolysaccharide/colanic/teichoic acid biosynthesis glycosyltransferase
MATTAAEVRSPDPEYQDLLHNSTHAGLHRPRKGGALHSTVLPFYGPLFELEVPIPVELEVPVSVPAPSTQAYSLPRASGTDLPTRLLNITVAALGLLLTAPLFVVIAALIKLTSRGPVFYKQKRVGLDRRWNETSPRADSRRVHDLGGRPFTMYKFRTMVTAAEHDSKEVWAKPRDERVTPIGRRLRTTRLDELPQLLNVLAGDMNIVGPRPERPTIFAEMRQAIPNYHMRQRVMPGITGWAQVNQAYDTCVDDVRRKVEYDLEYMSTRSASRDLKIMARTVPIMLFCRFGW